MRIYTYLLCALVGMVLTLLPGCGFHLPAEHQLSTTIPKLNVTGAYQSRFYKQVVLLLEAQGVEVNAQNSGFTPQASEEIPTLSIPEPKVEVPLVAVSSLADGLQYAIIVSYATTLSIPHHRPILMRNALTRSMLKKAGRALASDNEREIVTNETIDELAQQLVTRLAYLGRLSDPSSPDATPAELLISKDGSTKDLNLPEQLPQGLTLIEALQYQEAAERSAAKATPGLNRDLDELNNGQVVLDRSRYQLPKVKPQRVHEAPASLTVDGI
ncbi:MAG: hypothetical protein K6F05_08150 [Succinivibrio sp.]|nr:hypothetical protein [Succinivibrio sp.]